MVHDPLDQVLIEPAPDLARLIRPGRRVSLWWTMGVNQSYEGVRVAQSLINIALITGNKNVQFIEWVDHGYGIVDLNTERAIFEYWWQDKLTPDAPDVLGRQMISWARSDSGRPIPRHPDQIDDVTAHGLSVTPTEGTRSAPPAPLDRSAVNPR